MSTELQTNNNLIAIDSALNSLQEDKPNLEEKRIEAIRLLHRLKNKSQWMIGELLVQQEQILKERYLSWKKEKEKGNVPFDAEYTQLKSVYQWVEGNKNKLGFGERNARRYIRMREETDRETADRIGIKKAEIIRKAPKELQDNLREKVKEENWSTNKVQNFVESVKEKKKKEKFFEKEVKPHLPKINIRLDKKNQHRIFLEVAPSNRDMLNMLLQEKYLIKLKKDLYDVVNE